MRGVAVRRTCVTKIPAFVADGCMAQRTSGEADCRAARGRLQPGAWTGPVYRDDRHSRGIAGAVMLARFRGHGANTMSLIL
ncbi:MAG: hypothetical protein BGP23_00435 [Lysobacterales bacterium 66-474]|nr:MAG: hypothetical protein ABT18_11360 [Rhodanobacter sp. SCN 66-43]OJY85445.1 MAG: hypothetical protein BGP23_00435 [Xanthomonadales bacterium 66-474]